MAHRKPPRLEKTLTEVELELMTILWRIGGGTVNDVLEALPPTRPLAYTSVATILRILEQKGVLGTDKVGRGHRYQPLVPQDTYQAFALWRRVVDEERRTMPDVEVTHQLVDSCAMLLVTRPADFDVIVTENLFGDILSDEAAVLAGSLGMLPSASLANRMTDLGTFGLYEPIHGSAPDIAGHDRANPIGTILSAAMMMRSSFNRKDVSEAIEAAVSRSIDEGWRTADLASADDPDDGLVVVGTTGMATAVIDALEAAVPA